MMRRRWFVVAIVVLAVGCEKKARKEQVGGKRASVRDIGNVLQSFEMSDPAERVRWLAEGVSEMCGEACKCLDELGERGPWLVLTCPSLCDEAARKKAAAGDGDRMSALLSACEPTRVGLTAGTANLVTYDWLIAFVAGQYLADQYAAASAGDRAAIEKVMKPVRLPLRPGAGIAAPGTLPTATQATDVVPLGTFVAIDKSGGLRAGPMPVARLTPTGAVLDTAPGGQAPRTVADGFELSTLMNELAHGGGDDDLAALDDRMLQDDPPPPEPEEEEEVEDPGTAMALDEGKMGKKDSDRATGQYKMKNNNIDPQLARAQAIEEAKKAGILGSTAHGGFAAQGCPGDEGIYGGLLGQQVPDPAGPRHCAVGVTSDGAPGRRGPDGAKHALVIAHRDAPAMRVVEVLDALPDGGALAIEHSGQLAVFPVVFGGAAQRRDSPAPDENEKVELILEIGPESVLMVTTRVNEVMPFPLTSGAIDVEALTKAVAESMKTAFFIDRPELSIAVREGGKTSVLLQALDAAVVGGARVIVVKEWVERPASPPTGANDGSGYGVGNGGSHRGGANLPQVRIGQPTGTGDLDKAIIRRYIKRNIAKITYCYEKELLAKPRLEGEIKAEFFISPNGTVSSSKATGFDPKVATCVEGVIKKIEFPKPKSGAGMKVTYPFMFRPTGG